MLQLTADNYYSQEANQAYFSASQIKAFLDCEERAMAELRGAYEREPSLALQVGSYVDARLCGGDMDAFELSHPEIFTRQGELRSAFRQAEEIVERIERDPLAMRMLDGDHQRILTGEIFGQPFKAKLDCWLDFGRCKRIWMDYPDMEDLMMPHGAIVDLKVVRSFDSLYKEGSGRLNFIEFWGYDLQMAIYQELMRQQCLEQVPCYILAATKEENPNIGLFQIPQALMDANLEILKPRLERLAAVKAGEEAPIGCGNCGWCRETKKLTRATWLEGWA